MVAAVVGIDCIFIILYFHIACMCDLSNINFLTSDAKITWTTPPPQRGPLEISDGSVRETTQRLINGSPEGHLKWEFTLLNEKLVEVSWQRNGVTIGRKEASGRITIQPTSNFQEHFGISASDQATLIIYNVTEADDTVFSCVVRTTTKDWFDKIRVKVGGECFDLF